MLVQFLEIMEEDAAQQEPLVAIVLQMLEQTPIKIELVDGRGHQRLGSGRKSAADFVSYIMRKSQASPCCLVVCAIYIERLKERDTRVRLTPSNFQRLYLAALMLASKFLDDIHLQNKGWAKIGGIVLADLNRAELELLYSLDFHLQVTRDEYNKSARMMVSPHLPEPPTRGLRHAPLPLAQTPRGLHQDDCGAQTPASGQ